MRTLFYLVLTWSLCTLEATEENPLLFPPSPVSLKADIPKTETSFCKTDESIVSQSHAMQIHNNTLQYTSHTGTLTLQDGNKKDNAHIFFTAYFLDSLDHTVLARHNRPLVFCFNGGPGCASVFLHMGCFGPKKVVLKEASQGASAIPGTYKDNEQTLLETADLVFIDPPSTGFSRPADGIDAKRFYGVKEDAEVVSEFIRNFLTHYHRWSSPLYILGESYGTVRAVVTAAALETNYQTPISGLILLSPCLDYETTRTDTNDLALLLAIPTYSTIAWYHHKLPIELQEKSLPDLLDEVEEFVATDLRYALFLGNAIEESYKKEIAQKLANYTGLSEKYVSTSNLRIQNSRFIKELLRSKGKVVGAYDGRFVSDDTDIVGELPTAEPTVDGVVGTFTTGYNSYLFEELNWTKNDPYYSLNMKVWPWKGISHPDYSVQSYLNVLPHLERLMVKNQNLRLFVGSGLYDIVTPYFAADYMIGQLDLSEATLSRITQSYYEAGHMMYTDDKEHEALHADVKNFILRGADHESSGSN